MHIVELRPSGRKFSVAEGETVLKAALRQNIELPYGCKNGICGLCKASVSRGIVNGVAPLEADGTSKEVLLCCARPETDLLIDEGHKGVLSDVLPLEFRCEVISKALLCHDVMLVRLRVLAERLFAYSPGQYVDFLLGDGNRRSFSLAAASRQSNDIEIHVRRVANGRFTNHIFNEMRAGDVYHCEGPLGAFRLQAKASKPIIFLASGTGFAPIKAIVEDMLRKDEPRVCKFYWGGRRPGDLYMHTLAVEWSNRIKTFDYIPVISESIVEDGWSGRAGLVHQAVVDDLPCLSSYQVYACGSPVMVEAAKLRFTGERQLPHEEFYADPFVVHRNGEARAPGRSTASSSTVAAYDEVMST